MPSSGPYQATTLLALTTAKNIQWKFLLFSWQKINMFYVQVKMKSIYGLILKVTEKIKL